MSYDINHGFNLRRHESEYCPLQDHNSSTESGSGQIIGMSTKRNYADTDGSTSENDSDHSENTDDDQENEREIDPWASLKMEAMKKNLFLLHMVLKKKRPRKKHI